MTMSVTAALRGQIGEITAPLSKLAGMMPALQRPCGRSPLLECGSSLPLLPAPACWRRVCATGVPPVLGHGQDGHGTSARSALECGREAAALPCASLLAANFAPACWRRECRKQASGRKSGSKLHALQSSAPWESGRGHYFCLLVCICGSAARPLCELCVPYLSTRRTQSSSVISVRTVCVNPLPGNRGPASCPR